MDLDKRITIELSKDSRLLLASLCAGMELQPEDVVESALQVLAAIEYTRFSNYPGETHLENVLQYVAREHVDNLDFTRDAVAVGIAHDLEVMD